MQNKSFLDKLNVLAGQLDVGLCKTGLILFYRDSDDILYLSDGESEIPLHTWLEEQDLL